MTDAPDPSRFVRQTRLAAFGPASQARLGAARVLVVGAGGLGAPVVQYLAAAGVGHLTIVDDDAVERSNLNRQVLFGDADVGAKKAEVAAARARAIGGCATVRAAVVRLTPLNGADLLAGQDLVVDCTDGLPSKYLLNDLCVHQGVPLVHGAVTAFDGRVMVIAPSGRPCLRCAFPALPPAGTVPTCQQTGVLGASVGVVGSVMAQHAVMWFSERAPRTGVLSSIDLAAWRIHHMSLPPDPDCPACGTAPRVDGTDPEDYRPPRGGA